MVAPMPDIALLNANTTAALTARMAAAAAPLLPPGMALRALTAPFGPAYIADAEGCAVAARAVEAMARALVPPPAAAVVACFGDPGLSAARAVLPCPVVGMAEASLHAACQIGRRVGVLTGGAAWGPLIEALVAEIGLTGRLAGVRTLPLTGDRIAADPAGAEAALAAGVAALADAGADVVVLGGAGLAGLAPRLRPACPVPLLDSLACAVTQAAALATMGPLGGRRAPL
jgi:Asp/Glu/hydantoin racemase